MEEHEHNFSISICDIPGKDKAFFLYVDISSIDIAESLSATDIISIARNDITVE